jgi:hypothetical protein
LKPLFISEEEAIVKEKQFLLESDFPAGLGKPAQRALTAAGYQHLKQLTQASRANLLKLHGMGPKTLGILQNALAKKGWTFKN